MHIFLQHFYCFWLPKPHVLSWDSRLTLTVFLFFKTFADCSCKPHQTSRTNVWETEDEICFLKKKFNLIVVGVWINDAFKKEPFAAGLNTILKQPKHLNTVLCLLSWKQQFCLPNPNFLHQILTIQFKDQIVFCIWRNLQNQDLRSSTSPAFICKGGFGGFEHL